MFSIMLVAIPGLLLGIVLVIWMIREAGKTIRWSEDLRMGRDTSWYWKSRQETPWEMFRDRD